MTREETIKYLHLDEQEPIEEKENESSFNLTQNQYASVFTLLDRNESDWNEDSEDLDNSDDSKMYSTYYSNSGELELFADLDKDEYKITIRDKE